MVLAEIGGGLAERLEGGLVRAKAARSPEWKTRASAVPTTSTGTMIAPSR
ncbi:hypothetical protein SBADM41S_03443 [Streptomyces badius]